MVKDSFKVVLVDNESKPFDIEKKILSEIKVNFIYLNTMNANKIIMEARDADALMCTYANISSSVISELKKCKVIVRYGIGVDNIDVDAASKAGIWIANLPPEYSLLEVANHTIAMILALNRKLIVYDRDIRKGLWGFSIGAPIDRLDGQILGLVGFGNIAQSVAQKALGIGLEVYAFDPYIDKSFMDGNGVKKVDNLNDLLERSDIVSLHPPLNEKTRKMIGENELRRMKKSAYLINTGRGGLIDEPILIRALKENWIRGAGLDVYFTEPIDKNNELLKLYNTILTPHAAYYSEESQRNQQIIAAEAVLDVLKGKIPRSFFNKNLLIKYGKNVN